MLVITTNQNDFEYDIYSLVKAFYPEQEVKVISPATLSSGESATSDEHAPEIHLTFTADKILLRLRPATATSIVSPTAPATATAPASAIAPAFATASAAVTAPAAATGITNPPSQGSATNRTNDSDNTDSPPTGDTLTSSPHPLTQAEIPLPPAPNRIEVKNTLKQLIYRTLAAHTGRHLPWGALTGIRPVKIPMTLLAQGMPEDEILRHMQAVYLLSEEKGRLALDIAQREREILSALDYQAGYSLYLGIPFCPTTCLYCSFTSYPISAWRSRVADYLTALEKEMAAVAAIFNPRPLHSIYIGGGTPTTLEPAELDRLLSQIRRHFDLTGIREFTVEAGRPDSVTAEKLTVLKKYGVDRISINPQTMNPETLKIIGRQHTVAQVYEAFSLARSLGFANINMDLILGLPGETPADVAATMAAVAALRPDSLTIHSLAVKRAARLSRWIDEHGLDALQNTGETMAIAMKGAEAMGMFPYYLYRQKNMAGNLENIGFATPGHYGLYNILMMEEVQTIAALGAGTVSKQVYPDGRITRRDNVKDVTLYLERIDEMIARKQELFAMM